MDSSNNSLTGILSSSFELSGKMRSDNPASNTEEMHILDENENLRNRSNFFRSKNYLNYSRNVQKSQRRMSLSNEEILCDVKTNSSPIVNMDDVSSISSSKSARPKDIFVTNQSIDLHTLVKAYDMLPRSDRLHSKHLKNNLLDASEMEDLINDRKSSGFYDVENISTSGLEQYDIDTDKYTNLANEPMSWKKLATLILPHVGLILLTCTYTLLGASIFYSIERSNERDTKNEQLRTIDEARTKYLNGLWNLTRTSQISRDQFLEHGAENMSALTNLTFRAFEKYFMTANELMSNKSAEIWTFSTAIFFAVTVVTTIGYGNPVPISFTGRLTCILFALIGIPLTLVTIADVGKFFSEQLLNTYAYSILLKRRLREKYNKCRGIEAEPPPHPEHTHVCQKCRECKSMETTDMIKDTVESIKQEDIKIPATLVMVILISYTALGGLLMRYLENGWSFFDSFYYSFITMTTIGFGDLVPRKNGDIFIILVYIILGLAVTTMCIDLVGVQYIQKIHYFGRQLKEAQSALAIVGGKAVYLSSFYTNVLVKKYGFTNGQIAIISDVNILKDIASGGYLLKPYVPRDIKFIRYIDEATDSIPSSTESTTADCKYCHHRLSVTFVNTASLNSVLNEPEVEHGSRRLTLHMLNSPHTPRTPNVRNPALLPIYENSQTKKHNRSQSAGNRLDVPNNSGFVITDTTGEELAMAIANASNIANCLT